MSNFQIIITGICIFFIVVGVIVFAGLKGSSSSQSVPQIVVWGSVPKNLFDQFTTNVSLGLPTPLKIAYVEKDATTFNQEFVEAIATGKAPDAIILPQDLILANQNKLAIIPYTAFSQRDFKNTFVQEAEIYLTNSGIIALPFSLNPLVMYWNRDTLSSGGFARYPQTWDEVSILSQKLTNKDDAANIIKSGVALGEFSNITNAKELLLALLLQAGNPSVGLSPAPAASVFTFYTKFSNPTSLLYSWNRSLPASKDFFISGDLALYFGFASELPDIRAKNPQLNFDVAVLPQTNNADQKATFGSMLGFAFVRSSPYFAAAYGTLSTLLTAPALSKWTELTYLPPVRRDMLGTAPADPYLSVFYASALISRGWLDPSPSGTTGVFQSMIENIVSGAEKVSDATTRGSSEINNLMPAN